MLAMLRALDGFDARMLLGESYSRAWNYRETGILQSIGVASRMHAHAFAQGVAPACEGLVDRLRVPGASLLDVGVGVAGTAIALAQMWPEMRIVGIDVWQPSLALARENVDHAKLEDRIELREQGVESLDDRAAYDACYFALVFIPERAARIGFERTLESLKPGGWIVAGVHNFAGMTPESAAAMRVRAIQWGGPLWTAPELEDVLRSTGYTSVRSLPSPPGAPVIWTIGRKP